MKQLRWQMSLGTWLLLVTVLILAVSHYRTSLELSATRNELVDYRYQYGHLVLDDPSRPHFLKYANQENPWKWHVSFPEGKQYDLMAGVGILPASGIPNVSELRHVQATSLVGTGETVTMFVSLVESSRESLKLSIGCGGAQQSSQVFLKSDARWYAKSIFTSFSIGYRETFTAEPDEPFVVFYLKGRTPVAGGGAAADISPSEGIIVWCVPVN